MKISSALFTFLSILLQDKMCCRLLFSNLPPPAVNLNTSEPFQSIRKPCTTVSLCQQQRQAWNDKKTVCHKTSILARNTGKVCTNIAHNMPYPRSISHLHSCPDSPLKTEKTSRVSNNTWLSNTSLVVPAALFWKHP